MGGGRGGGGKMEVTSRRTGLAVAVNSPTGYAHPLSTAAKGIGTGPLRSGDDSRQALTLPNDVGSSRDTPGHNSTQPHTTPAANALKIFSDT